MVANPANNWREFTIDELKGNTDSAIAIGPFGSRMKSDCYVSSGVPVIRGNNLSDTKYFKGEFVYVSEPKADELRSSNVVADDLVFPHRGLIGEVGIVPANHSKRYVLSSSLMKLTCNRNLVEPLYLFYFFKSSIGRHELLKNTSQVGTPGIATPLTSLKSIRVKLPPLPEQKAIARILSSLDDKIELNQQMNGTLEAIARAIFKSWFVDFDPVRAKMDGRQPAGMDTATADLFPDSFEDSPLGKIPKGWNTVPFEDLFLIPQRSGLTKPKQTRGLGTYMVNMRELFAYRRIGDLEMERVPLTQSEAEKNLLQTGDLLFARRSLTWEGAGQCSIIIEAREHRTFEGSLIRCRLNPEKAVSWCYFYYFLSDEGRGRIESVIEQVAVAGIRSSDLAKLIVPAPSIKIQRCFGVLVEPLEKKMASNDTESRTLANIRDVLLPKLLSGEIRLKEAEKLVEVVA